jgi:predicted O-linked N-acetylglucosamine transferase (SPINDLY family)
MTDHREIYKKAVISLNRGNLIDAEKLFRSVLKDQPKHIGALNLLTICLMGMDRPREAEGFIESAIRINQSSDVSYYNYGLILKKLGRPQEAVEKFSLALNLKSDLSQTWNNRGAAFNDLKEYERAIADFDQAITLNRTYAEAYANKGKSLNLLKSYEAALASYSEALALKPDLAEALLGRGIVLHNLKRHLEAARAFAKLLEIDPKYPFAKGLLLHQKMLGCEWENIDRLIEEIESEIVAGQLSGEPFGWQGVAKSERSLELCASLYSNSEFPAKNEHSKKITSDRKRKIRVGYLSGEFRDQATSHLIVGVLENHDHTQFEIFAFDNGWDDQSDVRRRINSSVPNIVDISQLSDPTAAAIIGKNQIDILVNLNGYFGLHRMGVCAQRPAPIQINYLGFPGTLGAKYIDYIVADRHVIPENHKLFYKEKVVYLPNCYQANDQKKVVGSHVFNRRDWSLPDKGFVFCCFNNNYKIVPEIFNRWMQILLKVDDSILWLIEDNQSAANNLKKEAARRGVDAERLVFAKRTPMQHHLARHRLADLFLDTLPYNAHTTASDALWSGLPVLTQIGETFAGRVAASLLTAIGLPELITKTPQAYVDLAVELATNPEKLAGIRSTLVGNRLSTPLFNTQLFTGHIEAAYKAMYERHQLGLPPTHIYVSQ